MKKNRLILMGGTFDPPHIGHITAAETVMRELDAPKCLFIPTGSPPHKTVETCADHRFLMTLISAAHNPRFEVTRTETDREGTSYTFDTLAELKREYCKDGNKTEFIYITGTDALDKVFSWKHAEQVIKMTSFAVIARDGIKADKTVKKIKKHGGRVYLIDMPPVNVSSSELRLSAQRREGFNGCTPAVLEYIRRSALYTDDGKPLSLPVAKLKSALKKPKRFHHSLGTAETALKLALTYGEIPERAYLAGLLHDCARDLSAAELHAFVKDGRVKADESEIRGDLIYLLHADVGAYIAETEYGVTDAGILNAIKHHAAGRAGMSLLEKIIFIADCAEPHRSNEFSIHLRTFMHGGIDRAFMYALKDIKLRWTRDNGNNIHPRSLEALKEAEEK
jgi:nicotinate-nucleotide adenylyltransferase